MLKRVLHFMGHGDRRPVRWGILNCLDGQFHPVTEFPFEITVTDEENGREEVCLSLNPMPKGGLTLKAGSRRHPLHVNGKPAADSTLKPGLDYAIAVGSHCLLLHGSTDLESWRRRIHLAEWHVRKPGQKKSEGPFTLDALPGLAEKHAQDDVLPSGATQGFRLSSVVEAIRNSHVFDSGHGGLFFPGSGDQSLLHINTESGRLVCPVCWLKFDPGDVMHIAVHESLRGDPILGEDAPQRFFATHFNDRGQALDAMGAPCSDLACPHCRRKLPFGFLESAHHIFSIVGAPSAGKSYYLSVLIRELQNSLFKNFRLVFKDSDPTGNALLNEMKNQLFSAQSPEKAALVKTQLEGIMYERLPRYGRLVALPKPFVFDLAPDQDPSRKVSLVFYDNAGEHFEPGINTHESPGAQHVAASRGIFFLFDPTANQQFRTRLGHSPDPQLALEQRLDHQDVILSEMEVRIKNLLGLSPLEKASIPLAIIVGKCDVWLDLLGDNRLYYPVSDRSLDLNIVQANSQLIRNLLLELCPSVVANAESISAEVCYFGLSALGHSPLLLPDGQLAPDPSRINPIHVDVPTLWILSKICPQFVPTTGEL